MKRQPKRELGATASVAAATPLLARHFTAARAGRRSAVAPWHGLEEPQEAAFTRGEGRRDARSEEKGNALLVGKRREKGGGDSGGGKK
jgi:hypothetical protein